MRQLRSVEEIGENLRVILRLDLDLPMEDGKVLDNSRLIKSIPTIKLLLAKNNKMVIIGHRDRPGGVDARLSLKPVYTELMSILFADGQNIIESVFADDIRDSQMIEESLSAKQIVFGENLRFYAEEEANNLDLFEVLAGKCQAYVNDAFAVAHRRHASIMLYRVMPAFYGLGFIGETEKIEKVLTAERPLVVILGGAKEDKMDYIGSLLTIADRVLVGGKLPQLINDQFLMSNDKLVIAKLEENGLDIDGETIGKFKEIINTARTVVWAGAMGFYEDPVNRRGTEEIADAVANCQGYKIIAGGDTAASVRNLGLIDKIDYVCSGGGVMLEYLTKGTLTAWK